MSVSLFLFCIQVYLYHILDFMYKWYHTFVFLIYFKLEDNFFLQSCVGFCCTTTESAMRRIYIYIYMYLPSWASFPWMDKEVVVHIYSGILLSHKKTKCDSVDLRCVSLSDLPYLVWSSLGPSMLLQMALFYSLYGWVIFPCIYNIPLYIHPNSHILRICMSDSLWRYGL